MSQQQNKVQWVYSSTTNDELAQRYDEWAADYDADLERDFGWDGHVRCVGAFAARVPAGGAFIDVGAGTGLAGAELARRGYATVDAFDLSAGMLVQAQRTGAYRSVQQAVLGQPLPYGTDAYDGAVASGVFTTGHAPASGWDEVARIVKPGGIFVLTIRPDVYRDGGFADKDRELTAAGVWELIECQEAVPMLAKGEPDVAHEVRVYRILR
jgi:SAM-dependent methyltransferase